MARDEAKNSNIPIEKRFFGKLSEIFNSILGESIRREHNYFSAPDFIELNLMDKLRDIDEEELLEVNYFYTFCYL